MPVYTAAAASPSAWPVLMETVYQSLPRGGAAPRGARRSDVSLSDRLFATAVVAIPRKERYGAVKWAASALDISRQTVYDISRAIQRRLASPATPVRPPLATPLPPAAGVSHNELARAELTLLFPGGLTLRPMSHCLDELLGTSRSPAWLCTFFNQTGEPAGQVLNRADWSAVAPFFATRDELFFDGGGRGWWRGGRGHQGVGGVVAWSQGGGVDFGGRDSDSCPVPFFLVLGLCGLATILCLR